MTNTSAPGSGRRKIVAGLPATTLDSAEWDNSASLDSETVAALALLKEEQGADIHICGGITLTRSLLQAGLVDEFYPCLDEGANNHGKAHHDCRIHCPAAGAAARDR
ncbi:dihydrofolate reductase family protein [Catelliglobosispora koreensis]|uniref:dihydrofolate reductase family protein n=1 Tax=Catelliglobosispora koreensis TaxID=129052 RepID=UPI0012FCE808